MPEKEDRRPIGMMDSGVGGLTVLRATLRVLPDENYVYIGDTEFLPYGTKSPELVRELATDVAKALLQKERVKAIVVACNTVSAVALPDIQSLSNDVPIIGVIDPTVMHALGVKRTFSIAVIATETTIASGIYERKIKEIGGSQYAVISKATPAFVPLIEENPHNHPLMNDAIRMYLEDLKDDPNLGTLILGCTHYPMIKHQIEQYLGRRFAVVDSAQPTALALKHLLEREHLLRRKDSPTQIFFTSDDPSRAMEIARQFLGGELKIQRISIERRRNYPTTPM